MIFLLKKKVIRRILDDGKLQNWAPELNCWKGMKRKGAQFKQTADEIAADYEKNGWKRLTEPEAMLALLRDLKNWSHDGCDN